MLASKRVRGVPALRIVGHVFLGLGGLVLAVAAVFVVAEVTGRRTMPAQGTVIAVSNARPWVRFKTGDGRDVGFRGWVRYSSWEVGDKTAVVFDPQEPANAQIDGIAGRWFFPFRFGLLGGVFTAVGAGLTLAGRLARQPVG